MRLPLREVLFIESIVEGRKGKEREEEGRR